MAITAQSIVDRIQKKIGPGWKNTSADAFVAGRPDTEVKGVVTTYAPSLEVLKKAAASGKNMVISRESPFWARSAAQIRPGTGGTGPGGNPENGGAGRGPASMEGDSVFRAKRDFIAANNMVVYRFFENWTNQPEDPQLKALARALGWEKNYKPSGGTPWAKNNGFFTIPNATLKDTAVAIKKKLGIKSIRCGGDPNIKVSKAALWHGMYWIDDMQHMLAEPGVDLMVVGEPQWENELLLYNFDLHAAGIKKGIIILGQEISEEPGSAEMATWLKSFVTDVPVEFIAAGEPCWMPS